MLNSQKFFLFIFLIGLHLGILLQKNNLRTVSCATPSPGTRLPKCRKDIKDWYSATNFEILILWFKHKVTISNGFLLLKFLNGSLSQLLQPENNWEKRHLSISPAAPNLNLTHKYISPTQLSMCNAGKSQDWEVKKCTIDQKSEIFSWEENLGMWQKTLKIGNLFHKLNGSSNPRCAKFFEFTHCLPIATPEVSNRLPGWAVAPKDVKSWGRYPWYAHFISLVKITRFVLLILLNMKYISLDTELEGSLYDAGVFGV